MERIIIATNIGGSKETIIDGETGFLIENRNIKDLSDKIDQILSDKNAVVGVSIIANNSKDTLSINGYRRFPMQSVFKFQKQPDNDVEEFFFYRKNSESDAANDFRRCVGI